jgi:hypothetical protein
MSCTHPGRALGLALALLSFGRPCRADGPGAASRVEPPATPSRRATSLSTGFALVRQGAFEAAIAPLDLPADAVGFYSYNVPLGSCANTGLEMTSSSLLFLQQDTRTAPMPLSLFVIHDRPTNPAGGAAVFDFSGLPPAVVDVVQDDGGEGFAPSPPVGGTATATWNWGTCCTDGLAASGFETEPFCVRIHPQFTSGIRTWQLLGGPDPAAPTRTMLPSLTEDVYICGDCVTITCPGTIVAECNGAGAAFVNLQATGTSLCGGESVVNDRSPGGADGSGWFPVGGTDIRFTLIDGAGFSATCATSVFVQDTLPPDITTCPPPLELDCAGSADVPASDPRIQAWLASFAATDGCGNATLSNDAPSSFPSGCLGSRTVVTFTATDEGGRTSTCASGIVVHSQCLSLPADVGPALRVRDHGSPLAADVTAVLDWTLDAGLPRPADEHWHVLRSTDPRSLALLTATDPWTALTMDEGTPAATSRPLVHFSSILAAGPCEDESAD